MLAEDRRLWMRDRGLYFLLHIKQYIMCPWVCLAALSPYGIDREGCRVILQWICVIALGSRFLQWAVNKPAWLCPGGRHYLTMLPSAFGGNTVSGFQSSVHCTDIFEERVCNKSALHASACKLCRDVWDLLRIVSQHLADSGTHKPYRLKINFSLGLRFLPPHVTASALTPGRCKTSLHLGRTWLLLGSFLFSLFAK